VTGWLDEEIDDFLRSLPVVGGTPHQAAPVPDSSSAHETTLPAAHGLHLTDDPAERTRRRWRGRAESSSGSDQTHDRERPRALR
jgi:hypothetical protein